MTSNPPCITVLVCDDDARIRDALGEVIAAQPDLALVAFAVDRDEAVDLAERHAPAVAIIDVRMPGGGAHAVRGILRRSPQTRILAFSAYNDLAAIEEMDRAGAGAYLVKGARVREILAAIRGLAPNDDANGHGRLSRADQATSTSAVDPGDNPGNT
jgi:DNA-binding NarL/FixJ family response regulator